MDYIYIYVCVKPTFLIVIIMISQEACKSPKRRFPHCQSALIACHDEVGLVVVRCRLKLGPLVLMVLGS